ncbi:hypothetical protein [Pseudomonas sp. Bi70]|uniref:hypothetical protein n=1 Tax=Pseudomonas sp. Bi70 TaxID=2821127 RepID=UPI001E3CE780|nr:hypothetical protein [Pseudomonas sp. Bi70]
MPDLYRGFSRALDVLDQVNIFYHRARSPVDTDMKVHEVADQWFFENFGVYARSSSLICTTDFSQANTYGNITYKIVPAPSSPILYSDSMRDFLEHKIELDSLAEESIITWLESKCFKLVYDVSEIDHAFLGEVMVYCEKYQAFMRS